MSDTSDNRVNDPQQREDDLLMAEEEAVSRAEPAESGAFNDDQARGSNKDVEATADALAMPDEEREDTEQTHG